MLLDKIKYRSKITLNVLIGNKIFSGHLHTVFLDCLDVLFEMKVETLMSSCMEFVQVLDALMKTSNGDMRKAITTLQSAYRLKGDDSISEEDVYEIAGVSLITAQKEKESVGGRGESGDLTYKVVLKYQL